MMKKKKEKKKEKKRKKAETKKKTEQEEEKETTISDPNAWSALSRAGPDSWCKVRWTLFHSFFVILIIYSLSDHCMCSILLEESFLNVTDGLRSSLRSNYRTRRQ